MNTWQPYRPRLIRAAGVLSLAGWRLKTYEISFDDSAAQRGEFSLGLARASSFLPQPPASANRGGAGFLIFHSGASDHYLICGWWDAQNELFIRTLARPRDREEWDESGQRHSICVWDLDVIWHERNAWIACMLGGNGQSGVDAYLACTRPDGPSRDVRND